MTVNHSLSKNDKAWLSIFEQHNVVEFLTKNPYFIISANQINAVRECRLMTKFDYISTLPSIFREYNLSILPISRSRFAVGPFITHYQLPEVSQKATSFDFPSNIESIDYTNLYSESLALNCAYIMGIIDNLIGEVSLHTVSGRMSSGIFELAIQGSTSDKKYTLSIENSQCEIDAAYESANYFFLLEAKLGTLSNFMVRQLYYPFRLWQQRMTKPVVPVLMTFSNDIFTFYKFKFTSLLNYNSIQLIDVSSYSIVEEPIENSDLSNVYATIDPGEEPEGVPFPQADSFPRVIDLLSILFEQSLSRDEITLNYSFDARQTNYYTDAARYLGFLDKSRDGETGEVLFSLSEYGRKLLNKRHKQKTLNMVASILRRKVFHLAFYESKCIQGLPSIDAIAKIMQGTGIKLSESTIFRRARTVQSWIRWIWDQVS
jgi:hypothetical protein